MVSGFFSGGAADQFLKEGRLEEVRERTDIMGQQADTAFARVQNQAEQFKRTELIENLSIQNQKLLMLDKFFALNPEAARKPSMQQSRAGLVKLIDDLSAAANRSSTTGLSPALGAAEAGTPIAAAGAQARATAAGTEAGSTENVTGFDEFGNQIVRKVRSGTGETVRELFKGKKVETVTEEIPGVTKPEMKDFRKTAASADFSLNELDNLIRQLNSEEVFTGVASVAQRFGASVAGTIKQLATNSGGRAEINGKKVSESDLLSVGLYDFTAFGEAAQSQAFRSNMINLAYAIARSLDPGGRLSDKDVEIQLNALGANTGDKEQLLASLNEARRRVVGGLASTANVLRKTNPDVDNFIPDNLLSIIRGTPTVQPSTIPSAARSRTGGNVGPRTGVGFTIKSKAQ